MSILANSSVHEAVDARFPAPTSANGRQAHATSSTSRAPYALMHVHEEYRLLGWQMQRIIQLARAYPCPAKFPILTTAQSAHLETFADRLVQVYAELEQMLTPSMFQAMEQEYAAFECDMAKNNKQMRRQPPATPRKVRHG